MKIRDQFKVLRLCLVVFGLLSFCEANSQGSTNMKADKGVYYSRTRMVIDSLSTELESSLKARESLKIQNEKLKDKLSSVEIEKNQLLEDKSKLSSDLEEALGDNLQSSHTNSILFIFNIIVGILLLVAIIWMFLRKKSDANRFTVNDSITEESDNRFARIERLGNLRDKGLLTEEEFVFQKRQILGDK